MATRKQKDKLIELLKFTPATYRIELAAYGGECHIGTVDRKIYDFFKEHQISLNEYASSWDEDMWSFVPEDLRPFPPGSPYECENLIHASGAELSDLNQITVYDQDNNEVWSSTLGDEDLDQQGIEIECSNEAYIEQQPEGTVVIWGGQGEKGLLYGGEIELKAPFDPKKLIIRYDDCDGWLLINSVEYNGEEIYNDDYSTTGKWAEYKFVITGGEEVYEGVSREEVENKD